MQRQTHSIDWRPEFAKLDPFLAGGGGVARVFYASDDCAWRSFSAVLKQKYAKPGNSTWLSIRIDRNWHSTYLLDDILNEFERMLGEAGFPRRAQKEASSDVRFMSDNVFQREAYVYAENVNIGAESPLDQPPRRDRLVQGICERLAEVLSRNGHMMIVVNHAPLSEQSHFWNHFWICGLSGLVRYGLFLVHFVDQGVNEPIHDNAPAADVELVLPQGLHEDTRKEDAYDDLFDIFTSFGLSPEESAAAAIVHLESSYRRVSDIHDNLLRVLKAFANARRGST